MRHIGTQEMNGHAVTGLACCGLLKASRHDGTYATADIYDALFTYAPASAGAHQYEIASDADYTYALTRRSRMRVAGLFRLTTADGLHRRSHSFHYLFRPDFGASCRAPALLQSKAAARAAWSATVVALFAIYLLLYEFANFAICVPS